MIKPQELLSKPNHIMIEPTHPMIEPQQLMTEPDWASGCNHQSAKSNLNQIIQSCYLFLYKFYILSCRWPCWRWWGWAWGRCRGWPCWCRWDISWYTTHSISDQRAEWTHCPQNIYHHWIWFIDIFLGQELSLISFIFYLLLTQILSHVLVHICLTFLVA
jgi:hypothetical protein